MKCHLSDMWQVEGHQMLSSLLCSSMWTQKMAQLSGQPALHSLQLPIQLRLLICHSSSFHPNFSLYNSLQCSIQLLCSSVIHLFPSICCSSFYRWKCQFLSLSCSVFNTYALLIWHSSSFHPSAAVFFTQFKAWVFNSSQLSNWIALLLCHSSSFHPVAAMFFFDRWNICWTESFCRFGTQLLCSLVKFVCK